MVALVAAVAFLSAASLASAKPIASQRPYDIQGHRGGRGHTVENTLPSFAWGLINGVKSLEMDNGITKDGHVVVWHDENIDPTKCTDTAPVTANDASFPYVGKYIANLTLAQLKTIDCGSKRLAGFQLQILYPGTRIATLTEMFDFLECADPKANVQLNIESKINPLGGTTRGVDDFVNKQHAVFKTTPYYRIPGAITYQSFDWRTLVGMKKKEPGNRILRSALLDSTTVFGDNGNKSTSPWLAGTNPSKFNASTLGEQIVLAAHSIGAQLLSPAATDGSSNATDPALPGYVDFTTKLMVSKAHELGMQVKPWTVNGLNLIKRLVLDYKVDGVISDYPHDVARWAEFEANLKVAPGYDEKKVLKCLAKHNQVTSTAYLKSSHSY